MLARIRRAQEERDGGFTLIELLVVVIIIGILAAIAIPVFLSQRKKATDTQAESAAKNVATAEEAYLTDNPTGYFACAGAAACTNAAGTDLGEEGLKYNAPTSATGAGVWLAVTADGAKGYCAEAYYTPDGTTGSVDKYYFYDSENGGLTSNTTGTAPSGGACAVGTAPAPAGL